MNRREILMAGIGTTVAVSIPTVAASNPIVEPVKIETQNNHAKLMYNYLSAWGVKFEPLISPENGGVMGRYNNSQQYNLFVGGDIDSIEDRHIRKLALSVYQRVKSFRRNKIQFTSLVIPKRVESAKELIHLHVSIRLLTDYNVSTDSLMSRADVLFRIL